MTAVAAVECKTEAGCQCSPASHPPRPAQLCPPLPCLSCLHALPTRGLAYLPAYLPAFLLASLPVCSSVCSPGGLPATCPITRLLPAPLTRFLQRHE